MEDEKWAKIARFQMYEVSTLGRVRRTAPYTTNRFKNIAVPFLMKTQNDMSGYSVISLNNGNGRKTVMISHLVLEAFIGPRPNSKYEAAHFDGDKGNNRPSNLRWATDLENGADKRRHGTAPRGEKSAFAKLTERDVGEIRRRHKEECGSGFYRRVSVEYGISIRVLQKIVFRQKWAWLE